MALAFLDDQHRDFVECLPYVDMRKEFEVLREIGRGSFAKVVLVRQRDSGELYAAKMVRFDQSPSTNDASAHQSSSVQDRRAKDQFQFELTLGYFLSPCPYIIRTLSDAFRTNHHMIALMEPALGGDLASKLRDPNTRINEQQLKAIAIQLASAIQFIHERSLVHGDIRPENVLLLDPAMNVVKLGDFSRTKKKGSVVRYGTIMMPQQQNGNTTPASYMTTSHSSSGSEAESSRRSSGVTDSPQQLRQTNAVDAFWPPEIVALGPSDFYTVNASQDVWGYGLILICLSVERVPSWLVCSTKSDPIFADFIEALHSTTPGHASASGTSCDLHKTATTINGSLSFYQRSFSRLTASFISLLRGMLDIDPSNRAQIKTVRNCALHKWLQDVKSNNKPNNASKTQKTLGARSATTVEDSRLANSTSDFQTNNSSLPNSEHSSPALTRTQSETALDDLNISPQLVKNSSNSINAYHAPSSSSTASFSAGSSAGEPAFPK